VNRPKVEANCCRNSEGASELHLGGQGDEEGKGRAPDITDSAEPEEETQADLVDVP
jgi:hypothetical protein